MNSTPVRIGEAYHVVYYAPLHVARLGGFFAAQGLDAEIVPVGSFAEIAADWSNSAAGSGAGATAIAVGGIMRSLVAYDRNEALVPVHFARVNDRDGFLLLGRRPEFTWADLLERHLIVFAEAPTPLYVLRGLLRQKQLDPDRVRIIDDIPISDVAKAFGDGTGDFVLTQAHVAEELVRGGSAFLLKAMAGEAGPLPYSSYYCAPDFLTREPDTVRRVARGNAAAMRWMRSHSADEVWEMIQPAFGDGPADILRAATTRYKNLGIWDSDTTISPQSYAGLTTALQQGGLIARVAPYEMIIRDEAAREAEASV